VHGVCGTTGEEAPTDLPGGFELATTEGPGPRDGVPRSTVGRCLELEGIDDPLRAVSGPERKSTTVDLGQCLGRRHDSTVPHSTPLCACAALEQLEVEGACTAERRAGAGPVRRREPRRLISARRRLMSMVISACVWMSFDVPPNPPCG
jgi:hypothetical protein